MGREIASTGELARCEWPPSFTVQGGRYSETGLVFVEVFPTAPRTYLRRDGQSFVEAELACWEAWLAVQACPYHPEHGPFERRDYTNGSGFCVHCGAWFGPEVTRLLPLPHSRPAYLTGEALERFMRTGRWE